MLDHKAFRAHFPIFSGDKKLVYFDSAATSQKPLSVIEGMSDFYKNAYGTVHRGVYGLSQNATACYEGVRCQVARFLNASLEEIVFTRGTTTGLNLLASAFSRLFSDGDIIISEMEHHSNMVPWQRLAKEKGLNLIIIPFNDKGVLDLEFFKKKLSSKTRIVSMGHISNVLGTINPIAEMVEFAHRVGALFVLDAAQSVGHRALDVKALDVDFLVFSAHKIYGPTGLGILYGRSGLLNSLEPYELGGDMVTEVRLDESFYQEAPLRFEAGTPSIAEVIGFGCAVDFIDSFGLEKIALYEKELTRYARSLLEEVPGLRFLGEQEERGSLLTFVINRIHPLDVTTLMDLRGFAFRSGHMCAMPTLMHFGVKEAMRVSFAPYNNKEEVDSFVFHLKEILSGGLL